MDAPPSDTDRPPQTEDGDGPRPPPRFSSTALVATVIAVIAVLVAILLGSVTAPTGIFRFGEKPAPPSRPWTTGDGVLFRIDYDELVRLATPLTPLYDKGLFPFDLLDFSSSSINATDSDDKEREMILRMAQARVAERRDGESFVEPESVPTEDRFNGLYPAVGKLVSQVGKNVKECTGTMISKNVILTADHCLPWDADPRDPNTQQPMKFIPAFDGGLSSESDRQPWGIATVKRCLGINPPKRGGLDLAACQLDNNYPRFGKVNHPETGDDPVEWFTRRAWHSIGYPSTVEGTALSQRRFGPFFSGDVQYIDALDYGEFKADFFARPGWSGGPAYVKAASDNRQSLIGAIATHCAGGAGFDPMNCDGAIATVFTGGFRMRALAQLSIYDWSYAWNSGWALRDESPQT